MTCISLSISNILLMEATFSWVVYNLRPVRRSDTIAFTKRIQKTSQNKQNKNNERYQQTTSSCSTNINFVERVKKRLFSKELASKPYYHYSLAQTAALDRKSPKVDQRRQPGFSFSSKEDPTHSLWPVIQTLEVKALPCISFNNRFPKDTFGRQDSWQELNWSKKYVEKDHWRVSWVYPSWKRCQNLVLWGRIMDEQTGKKHRQMTTGIRLFPRPFFKLAVVVWMGEEDEGVHQHQYSIMLTFIHHKFVYSIALRYHQPVSVRVLCKQQTKKPERNPPS